MKTKLTAAFCTVLALIAVPLVVADEEKAVTEKTSDQHHKQVQAIDTYVRQTEDKVDRLTRKEVTLDANAIAKVTDEKWAKLHTYSDGDKVERLKVYPAAGSKTEEFYYRDGQLVFAFIEPSGAGKHGHESDAKGTKYYFENGHLIAVAEDGKMGPVSEAARTMAEKITRESQAYLETGK
jgi:hypothetical protein